MFDIFGEVCRSFLLHLLQQSLYHRVPLQVYCLREEEVYFVQG